VEEGFSVILKHFCPKIILIMVLNRQSFFFWQIIQLKLPYLCRLKGEDIIVRLGEYDVGEEQELPFQDIHVRSVVINGGYHSGTLRNDIAILLLNAPARLSAYIKPACLPPPQDLSGMVCTVTGWGRNRPRTYTPCLPLIKILFFFHFLNNKHFPTDFQKPKII
jgi:Trypsin